MHHHSPPGREQDTNKVELVKNKVIKSRLFIAESQVPISMDDEAMWRKRTNSCCHSLITVLAQLDDNDEIDNITGVTI